MSLRTRIISIFIFSILIELGLNVERLAMAQGSRLSLISLPISVYILDDQRGKLSSPSRNERVIPKFMS